VSIEGQRQVRTTNQVMRLEKTENGSWIVLGTTPDTPLSSPVESDESAIRRVIATYETALKTKDVDLYRSVRPGLSAAEEAALRESFRQIDNQVTITIVDIRVGGKTAISWISRGDVVTVGGLRQATRVRQTLFLEKSASAWIITAIEK
jgi:ketosteroid isomerase-like protein